MLNRSNRVENSVFSRVLKKIGKNIVIDEDLNRVLHEQGVTPSFFHKGEISGKNNCGVNFSDLGIESLYNKEQTEKTGNKTNPDKELSIFVMVHGGIPIDTNEPIYRKREQEREKIKNQIMKQTGKGLFDFYDIETGMAKYRGFNLYADRIRTYTLMGENVRMHNGYWRLHYIMYLKEDIITLILIYLAVEFHWKSKNNDYIYPYKKIYSNCPVKKNYENSDCNNSGCNSNSNSECNPSNLESPRKVSRRSLANNCKTSDNNNKKVIRQIKKGDTSMLDVDIGFGDKELIDESYICFMYTQKKKNPQNGKIEKDKNGDVIYYYNLLKINLKETEKDKNGSGQLLYNLNEKKLLYLSDLILYIEEIIKLIEEEAKEPLYKIYDLVYCQGGVDEEEIPESKYAKFIQRGYTLYTKEDKNKLKNKNKEELDTNYIFYQKIFNAAHYTNKGKEINDRMRVLKKNINNDRILDIFTTFPNVLQKSNIYEKPKKELNLLNICPDEADDFKKMSIILDKITEQKKGGKRDKNKKNIKSKPKQEKKKIENVKPKTKSTSNKKTKKQDGRKGKYQCGGCGCTHKTKEALNKCKKD